MAVKLQKKMEKPKFVQKIEKKDYIERTSDVPVKTFVPHQSMKLKELVERFERGQRLNVHENFRPMSNFTENSLYEEGFDDAPPDDVHDVVDVHAYYMEHQEHKHDFAKRQKGKAKAASEDPQAPQVSPTLPPDPAKS